MKAPLRITPDLTPSMMAFRLALTYAVIGGAWVAFSDRVLGNVGLPASLERLVGTTKGLLFVLVTAGVLYVLSRAGLSRVLDTQAELRVQEMRIRQAYVDVLDAVTGGKLVLVTDDEMQQELGTPLTEERPVQSPSELAEIRCRIRAAAEELVSPKVAAAVLNGSGEALNNVLAHAGSGVYEVLHKDRVLQVRVSDNGPGIDFRLLPKATLLPGFSTAKSLGMGFTIMLQLSERVLLCTEPGATTVILEFRH